MQQAQEDEPQHERSRQQEEDAGDVAGEREEDGEQRHDGAEGDRHGAEAQAQPADLVVLVGRDAAGVQLRPQLSHSQRSP